MYLTVEAVLHKIEEQWSCKTQLTNGDADVQGVKMIGTLDQIKSDGFIYLIECTTLDESSSLDQKGTVIILLDSPSSKAFTLQKAKGILPNANVILIESSCLIYEVLNIISEMIAHNSEITAKPAAMFNTIIKGRGVQYIIDIASELLENPVLLGDANHRLLAASKFKEVDDAPWMEFRNIGYCTYDYTQRYGFKKWIETSVKTRKAVIGDLGDAFKYQRIFCTVNVEDRVFGHLAVLEYNRPFQEKDLEITEFICQTLASEMRNQYQVNTNDRMTSRLLLDILQGVPMTADQVKDRIKGLKLYLPEKWQLMAIRFNSYADTFEVISYLRETAKELGLISDIVVFEDHLIALIQKMPTPQERPKVRENLERILARYDMYAGFSHYFSEMEKIHAHYKHAISAIKAGMKIDNEKTMYRYEDYAVYDMIQVFHHEHDVMEYCHPAVLKLKAYDQSHKTDYLLSLYMYIIHMGNVVSTAEALYIHRNTMSYRLNKIQEILGSDLQDENFRMSIFFSYKSMEYLDLL